MRILICTQAVDTKDPALGFFVRWIEEIAKQCDSIIVVCLRKGEHHLLKNVEVISLGERNRFLRALEVCTIAFGRRREYDAVFVHMNPEYLVAAGWLWRLMHKKTVLWYTHKSVNLHLRIAAFFAHALLTAAKESFRLPSTKLTVLGHGIDTDFFTPDTRSVRGTHVLSVGRLDPSKHHDLLIRAAQKAGRTLRIAGDGPQKAALVALADEIGASVLFLGGLTQEQLRDEYRQAAYFVHASTTGGLDKVVLEAAACDCAVITTVEWMRAYFPLQYVAATPEAIADAIHREVRESPGTAAQIREHYSLTGLIPKIMQSLRI